MVQIYLYNIVCTDCTHRLCLNGIKPALQLQQYKLFRTIGIGNLYLRIERLGAMEVDSRMDH